MTEEMEIHVEDENGKPIDLSDAYVYRDDSGVVVEDSRGCRTLIMHQSELAAMANQSPADDPSVYVYDAVNDRRWRIDIPRLVDVKAAYVGGEINEIELEQQIEQALRHYGDPADESEFIAGG